MQLSDRFGEEYWLGPPMAVPPASWGDTEEVARWFAGEVVLDRTARSLLSDACTAVDPDDEHAVADWLATQLDTGSLRIWRRVPPLAVSCDASVSIEAAPLLSDLVVDERTWIGWEVLDPHGRPVPGVAYELNTPDGEIRTGVTDAQGRVSESGIAAGTCAIRFVSNAA